MTLTELMQHRMTRYVPDSRMRSLRRLAPAEAPAEAPAGTGTATCLRSVSHRHSDMLEQHIAAAPWASAEPPAGTELTSFFRATRSSSESTCGSARSAASAAAPSAFAATASAACAQAGSLSLPRAPQSRLLRPDQPPPARSDRAGDGRGPGSPGQAPARLKENWSTADVAC